MNRHNLIPHDRRRRRAVRRAGVRWAVATAALSVVLTVTATGLSAALPSPAADAAEADRTAAAAAVARAAAGRDRAAARSVAAALAAAREVADQPDWSLLLADLSRRLGDDGVLSGCDLSAEPKGPLALRLTGVARTQPAVTALALRLERAGLFDRVDLLRTSPAKLMGDDAVGFQIVCTFAPAAGGGRVP